MSSVDQRVVEMKFNYSAFAKGITDTLASLTKLQDGLKLNGASQGFTEAQSGAEQLGQSTGMLGGQFSALQAMAFGALASIGAKAVQTGTQVAKSLTISPVMQGFQEYETNMTSIQTILANTSAAGTGLTEVNAALDEMNLYSDKTIYNFSEMAKNVGTFTAAGVDLDTATGSIKGIANLAALSGSNSQQAAGAMYQLSQEIASGKVTLMGWNSVVNAGMGGSVFQRALAETAVAMGKIDKSSLTLEGDMKNVKIAGESFRDSISAEGGGESWLTSDVLTNTLQQFTGDLNEAELAAQGFTKEQITAIKAQAAMAVGAATEVKTFTGLMDTLKEGVASGWSSTFRILVGDFEESKKLFTGISNAVGGFLGGISDRRNEMLTKWKEQGGRDALIEGMKNGLIALGRVLAPIGQAFREIFPRQTFADLVRFTNTFAAFTKSLIPSYETMDQIQDVFAGFFAILGIGWEVLKQVVGLFGRLFGSATEGSSGILKFAADIGHWLVQAHRAVQNGEALTNFFDRLGDFLEKPIDMIKDLIGWVGKLTEGMGASEAGSSFAAIFEPIGEAGDRLEIIGDRIMAVLKNIREGFGNFVDTIKGWFKNLGSVISEAWSGTGWEFNADTIMKALGLGAGVGIGALLIKAMTGIKKALGNFSLLGSGGEGVLNGIKESLEGLTGTFKAMQQNLKAETLLKIAAAIGIMAVSVLILAGIDQDGLIRASVAMGVMIAELVAGLAALDKVGGMWAAIKLQKLGIALVLLAGAVLILSFAMKQLSGMSWEELGKGLAGLAGMLVLLAGAAKLMEGKNQAMVKTGASLLLLAIAVRILVGAVKDLSDMGWEELGKGIAGVAVLLGALGLFSRFAEADKGGLSSGLGLVLLAVAIKLLASAVGDFAQYNWEELGQGMAGIGAGLALIAGAMFLIPPDGGLSKGLGVLAMAFAMKILAQAVGMFAELSWVDMAKGLIAMNFALGSITTALERLDPGQLGKAVAILVVAAALKVVASALEDMGSLSWNELVKGLLGLTVSLMMIAGALKVMTGTIAGSAALMVAALALRVLFPVIEGFANMSWAELVKGMLGLVGVLAILAVAAIVLTPLAPVLLIVGAALSLIGIAVVLAAGGVMLFAMALTALAASGAAGAAAFKVMLGVFIGMVPMMLAAVGAIIVGVAKIILEAAPIIVAAWVAILEAMLQGIIDLTPKLVETFLTLLSAGLEAILSITPTIVETGMKVLTAFIQGIADKLPDLIDAATDLIVNFLDGLTRNLPRIIEAGANLIKKFMKGLSDTIPEVVEAGFQMIIDINNGIADAIREKSDELIASGLNIVDAIIDGVVKGVKQLGKKAIDSVKGLAGDMVDGAKDFLHINSPSKVFRDEVGMAVPEGIAVGIDKYGYMATDSTVAMGKNMLDTMGKTISGLGSMVGGMDEFNPVITPVLDLSAVQSGASNIGDILGVAPIDLSGSLSSARDASAGYAANLAALTELTEAQTGTTVNMTQINNSPKALSSADIYRNTNNQISRAKGALTNAN